MKVYLMLLFWTSLHGFETLEVAQRYAQQIPEFPESDTLDVDKPNFTSLYKKLSPYWWQRVMRRIGIQKPLWEPADFVRLLHEVVKQRGATDLAKEYFVIENKRVSVEEKAQITVSADTSLVIFGALHGAFHSFVRDLTELVKQGVIDERFRIQGEHTYLFCLGNAIDLSAYSLETVSLIFRLMLVNKDKFFYVKGEHEMEELWRHYGLYAELKQRTSEFPLKEMADALDALFTTLPHEVPIDMPTGERLMLAAQDGQKADVVIMGDDPQKKYRRGQGLYLMDGPVTTWSVVSSPVKLYRVRYGFFYDSFVKVQLQKRLYESTIQVYYNDGKPYFKRGPTYNLLTGNLLVRGIPPVPVTSPAAVDYDAADLDDRITFLQEQVDRLRKQVNLIDKQVPKIIIHTPTSAKRFEKLRTDVPMTLKELNRVARDSERNYNLLVDDLEHLILAARAKGVSVVLPEEHVHTDEQSIVLGTTLDLSKSAKGLGVPFRSGMALKVNKQNREGGINGKTVKLIFLDDGYIPAISRQNIEKLIAEYHTPFILCPGGTPTLLSVMDLIRDKKILVLFPQSGSPLFRTPDLTHVVNFRASFEDEGKQLTEYILKTYFPKNFVFFYQDDAFGMSILKGAREALKQAKMPPGVEVSYLANTTYFKEAAQKIRNANPDAIGFFATGPATIQLIRDIGVEFFANKNLYAVSSVGDEATIRVLKDKGLNVILGHVVPNPETSMLPIVKEYREQIKKQGQKENVFSLEAYITTSITFDLMSKLSWPITMEKLIRQVEQSRGYEFKGLTLTFNPQTRSLANYLWIDAGDEQWIKREISKQ